MAVRVPAGRAEEARAMMVKLFPEGFEEHEEPDGVELAAYTDWRGEERLWQVFGAAEAAPVAPDWAERWRTFHRPVRVGPLWVGPPWLDPDEDSLAIVIDPGRAFGTGAHPTTRLCLELLLGLDVRGSLLDIGCGSGVIAIAAAKLGFDPVVAIDLDPAAVEATDRNASANAAAVQSRLVDAFDSDADLPEVDVCVANIAREAVLRIAPRVRSGLFVTSGYMAGARPAPPGFRLVAERSAEGWAADVFAPE